TCALPISDGPPGPELLLAAERAEEVRDQAVHQLEIRRQRRRILLRVVEDLLAIALRVHRRAGAAVDEDELRPENEAFALHVHPCRNHAAAAEAVERFLIALDEPRRRAVGEEDRAGDDERILIFLADAFPVRSVGEEALVRLEIFFVLDVLRQGDTLLAAIAVGRARRRAT